MPKKQDRNKSLANLRPRKKGDPPGPGRPPGSKDGIGAYLNRLLEKAPPAQVWDKLKGLGIKDAKGSNAKAIANTLIVMALGGDLAAVKLLKDYTEARKLSIDMNANVDVTDYSKLSDKELAQLERIMSKAVDG